MSESNLFNKSVLFKIRIVDPYMFLSNNKKGFLLSKQICAAAQRSEQMVS